MAKKISFYLALLITWHTVNGQVTDQQETYHDRELLAFDELFAQPVLSLQMDAQGFMWMASRDVLARFDGIHMQKFLEVDDSLMQSIGPIEKIISGGNDKIWICTKRGVIDFELKTGKYRWFNFEDILSNRRKFTNALLYKNIYQEDDKLWVGTNFGLIEFDLRKEVVAGFYQVFADHPGQVNDILFILPCDEQHLWIATANCIYRFNIKSKSFSNDILRNKISKRFADLCIDRSPDGRLWIGYGGDLYCYDPSLDSLRDEIQNFAEFVTGHSFGDQQLYSNDSLTWDLATRIDQVQVMDDQRIMVATRESIVAYNHSNRSYVNIWQDEPDDRSGAIHDIYFETVNSIWFSHEFKGIHCAYTKNQPVHFLRHMIERSGDILSTAFNIDVFDDGEVWIERHNGRGLARFDLGSNTIQEYPAEKLGYAITRRSVRDRDGILWAIADGGIIYSFQPETAHYQYFHCPDTLSPRSHWYFAMALDDLDHVWAGGVGSGLVRMEMSTGKYEIYNEEYGNSNGFALEPVWQILNIEKGKLLVISEFEVILLSIAEHVQKNGTVEYDYHFSRYMDKNFEEIFQHFKWGCISGFYDSRGNLWLGTDGNGAVCYSPQNNEYRYYNIDNGLASNVVTGIIEDNEGNIWFTTAKGLSRLDPVSGTLFNLFDLKESDLPTYGFDWWDIHKDPQGFLYFGVLEDPVYLDPADFVKIAQEEKKIVLSDLKINNISQTGRANSRFPYLVNFLDEIHLTHRDHLVSIDYGVLDYLNTAKYNYRYMLKGFDKEWIYAGPNTLLSYSNLPAGKYTLIVNYSTTHSFDQKNAVSLGIVKSPAPWNTWWAWLGYVFLVIATGTSMILLIFKRNRIRKELRKEHELVEKMREIEEAKSRFFSQISHEVRTPLSLILQPVEALFSGEIKGGEKKLYGMIRRNARRLKDLMDQILDYSRMESGKQTLNTGAHDIIELLRLAVANFSSSAEYKKIDLIFRTEGINSLIMEFDREKMEKVVDNLISNALKFTPPGGQVIVSLEKYARCDQLMNRIPHLALPKDHQVLLISVKDTGIGIPAQLHKRIFNRFDRGYIEHDYKYEGIGLGLSIVKELVALHRGKVWVQNNTGPGAVFYVALPLTSEHISEPVQSGQPVSIRKDTGDNTGEPEPEEVKSLPEEEKEKSSLLFIEDNPDMRKFLRSFLEQEYDFFEAENGEKGLSLARERIPDIIISDIMMPGIDGVEVVKTIKSDRRTCHIPIILLTARAAKEDRIDALKTGADDFIVKPFDMQELKYRIRNQLHQMERLRERNIKTFLIRDFRPGVISNDDVFLTELADAVNRNLDNSAFNVTELSREMGISRTQLFRKLKALTGKQPSDFIRCLRLKKAVELMLDGSSNLSEIAYDTGFNSISYFSRRFKEIYLVSPSEYLKDLSRRRDTGLFTS